MPLTMLTNGQESTVKKVTGKDEVRAFLRNLGFVEGEQVRKLLQNRGMAAYLVRGTLIALRRGDAKKILIQ